MKPRDVAELIKTAVKNLDMPAIHLWGPPGVGKSQVCRQVTKEEGVGFVDMRLSMMDPSDIKGLPFPENGKTKWLPPSEFPTEGRGMLLLDEINLAPPLVQASAYQLVYDRRVGEYIMPNGWIIIAAGNKAGHGANTFKMAAPLRNRFIHIDFEYNIDDWREWAIKNNIATEVIEFVSYRPDLLFDFKPDRQDNAFPTPRSWEFVSKILRNSSNIKPDLRHHIIIGTVGEAAAIEFKSYLTLKEELPNIEEILAGKDHMAKQFDVACAVVTALVVRAAPNQFERLLKYSTKIDSKEVAVLMVKLMLNKDKQAVLNAPSWKAVANDYFDLMTWQAT